MTTDAVFESSENRKDRRELNLLQGDTASEASRGMGRSRLRYMKGPVRGTLLGAIRLSGQDNVPI
jgi:hypothetical protein